MIQDWRFYFDALILSGRQNYFFSSFFSSAFLAAGL